MNRLFRMCVVAASMAAVLGVATGSEGSGDRRDDSSFTLAVFGDWPYSQKLLTNGIC
jgi:hypothetical protein